MITPPVIITTALIWAAIFGAVVGIRLISAYLAHRDVTKTFDRDDIAAISARRKEATR